MAKAFSIVIIFLILPVAALAINLGSTTKGGTIQVEENGTAEFSLVFWSSDAVNRTLFLSVKKNPDNLEIEIEKTDIVISSLHGNEMVFASGVYVPATSVKVFAKNVAIGVHSFIISAETSEREGQVQAVQERLFNLTLQSSKIPEGRGGAPGIPWIGIPDLGANSRYVYLAAIFAVILIISLAIYKYS